MNFIKKKIKGSKKAITSDDDDLDPNLFHVPQVSEGAPEGWVPYDQRIDEESEEWQAFRQLTQRVTDTLQKTQQNLSKIVASSAVDEDGKDIRPVTVADDEDREPTPTDSGKPERPPRPPPPARPRPPPPPLAPASTSALEFDLRADFGFGPPAPLPTATVPSILLTSGSLFLDDDEVVASDEDDPFDTSFVSEVSISKAISPLEPPDLDGFDVTDDRPEVDDDDDPFIVKASVLSAMDPFDSFLGRAKSPNPFATELSSSNPFADAGDTAAAATDDDDSFFAELPVPNPFATDVLPTASDLLELDFSAPASVFSVTKVQSDDIASLFGGAVATEAVVVNPFATSSSAQPSAMAIGDLFALDPLDVVARAPSSQAPSRPTPAPFGGGASDPFGAREPTDVPDLFSFETDGSATEATGDPFGTASPRAPTDDPLAAAFGVETAPATKRDIYDDGASMAFDSVFTVPIVERDSHDAGVAAAAFDSAFTVPTRPPPLPPAIKKPECPETFPATTPAKKETGQQPPPRPPPPRPPARPPPPTVAVAPVDGLGPWDETFGADSKGGISSKTTVAKDPFDAFEAPGAKDIAAPTLKPIVACDPFGLDLLTEGKMDDKVEFEPIPAMVAKSAAAAAAAAATDVFDAFDVDVAPEPRKKSLEPVPASITASQAISAIDLFSGMDAFSVERKPLARSDLPRPPSVEELDAFSVGAATDVTDDQPSAAVAPMDLMGGDVDFFAPLQVEDKSIMEATPVPPSDDTVPFTDTDDAAFDAFEAKFQNVQGQTAASDAFDPFSDATSGGGTAAAVEQGFGLADEFDPFFSIKETPAAPKPSPARFAEPKDGADAKASTAAAVESDSDSDDSGPDLSVFIRPKMREMSDVGANLHLGPIPALAPPPKSPLRSPTHASPMPSPRFNPFDKEPGAPDEARDSEATPSLPDDEVGTVAPPLDLPGVGPGQDAASAVTPAAAVELGESQESPGSPLFEADDTEPLEDFYPSGAADEGWELLLRQPSKKKLTSQRFWKKVWVTVSEHGVVHLYNKREDRDAFQELPLQACYSLSEVGAQQYDAYGKIFTVKLQYVFYRERVGVRPAQISKVAHGQIGSLGQLAKLGLPLEHAPQVSQLLKLGSQLYSELRAFVRVLEDALFRLTVHRDRALAYKTEEVQVTVIDELRADVAAAGQVLLQLARVRVFFLAFVTSMPDVEIGLNDITKQGKEVVGRHDIIPVVTEEWIRLEKCEFHSCVLVDEFDKHRNIKFHPPDACFFELMRFRVRPPRNRELPLQVKTTMSVIGNRVEIRADVLVPGCISRKHGQIPCEDVAIRFPLPECWIYLFRVEKHFRYGSVKSASRKPGKIKGLERFMGGGLSVEPSLIEVSTGQAKYEHHHRAIVWRIPRLPKDGQGAYTTQLFLCRMELTSYDQIPEEFDHYVYVEFSMPATTVSHTTVRSVSVTNPNPPEKYVKYLARHEYRIEMEHVNVASECEYIAATAVSGSSAAGSSSTGGSNGSPVPSQ